MCHPGAPTFIDMNIQPTDANYTYKSMMICCNNRYKIAVKTLTVE